MTDADTLAEQRKHTRYEVPTGSFVAIGPQNTILGQIIDISMGGVAFRYVDSRTPTEGSHLDMFLTERDFCLGKVPITTVSDYEIENTVSCKIIDGIPRCCRAMKRSSVQFGDLTHHQKSQLEGFIQNYNTGVA